MNTDPLSAISIRAEMKIISRRSELISFGAASAFTAIGGLAAVSCTFSLFTSDALVAHTFLGTVSALGAMFTGRAAIRSYRELLFNAMTDINRIMTLQLENDNFRGRLWDIYLGTPLAGEALAAGESSGGSREGATLSPAANVYRINAKRKEPFQ